MKDYIEKPIMKIIVPICKSEKYECVDFGNAFFITASKNKNDVILEKETISDNSILIDSITLFMNLSNDAKYCDIKKPMHDYITEKDIKYIIEYCNKWGLPYIMKRSDLEKFQPSNDSGINTLEYYKNVNFDDIDYKPESAFKPLEDDLFHHYQFDQDNNSYIAQFHLESFICNLRLIYCDFLHILVFNKMINEPQFKKKITKDSFTKNYIKTLNRKEKYLDLLTPKIASFRTYWSGMDFTMETNSLLHLTVYYLCFFASCGKLDGGYIQACKCCGKFFTPIRKSQIYCSDYCKKREWDRKNR